MFGFTRKIIASLAIGAGLFTVGGCQSSGNGSVEAAVAAPSTQAVTCDACKATWVQVPTKNDKGRVLSYHQEKKMVCPMCKDAVQTFFSTGKLEHSCSACGGNMSICEAHGE